MKHFNLHLVSDSTGETVSSVARAALAQFDDIEPEEFSWTLVRSKTQLERVIESIHKHPGVVMYTLVDHALRDSLKLECAKRGLPCIAIIAPVVAELSSYLGEKIHALPGRQHELNEEYFTRVDAINYTLAHDDGQGHTLEEADIVLVGVSRTSKSPTCVYLAYKGFKAANVPFVMGCPLPAALETLKKPLVVGLTINPERLQQIRKSRLLSLNQENDTNYVDLDHMEAEIAESRKLYHKHKWPVIDVTKRSVEETAATIVQYFKKHRKKCMVTGKAKVAGVIGWPVAHSLSPRLHGFWLEKYAIDGAYIPLAVPPTALGEVVRALPKMGFAGVNLTLPHKELVLPHLDEIDPHAKAIGAVNTIVIKEGRLIGSNTDVDGFAENIRAQLPRQKKRAVVIGAGGAARAVVSALIGLGFSDIVITNRTPEKAAALVKRFDHDFTIYSWDKRSQALKNAQLLVNTTTLGLKDHAPLEIDLTLLPKTALVTDIVYTPLMTPLLKAAKKRGNPVVDGLGMLIHQAVPGFEAWFGKRPKITDEVRKHLLK